MWYVKWDILVGVYHNDIQSQKDWSICGIQLKRFYLIYYIDILVYAPILSKSNINVNISKETIHFQKFSWWFLFKNSQYSFVPKFEISRCQPVAKPDRFLDIEGFMVKPLASKPLTIYPIHACGVSQILERVPISQRLTLMSSEPQCTCPMIC